MGKMKLRNRQIKILAGFVTSLLVIFAYQNCANHDVNTLESSTARPRVNGEGYQGCPDCDGSPVSSDLSGAGLQEAVYSKMGACSNGSMGVQTKVQVKGDQAYLVFEQCASRSAQLISSTEWQYVDSSKAAIIYQGDILNKN